MAAVECSDFEEKVDNKSCFNKILLPKISYLPVSSIIYLLVVMSLVALCDVFPVLHRSFL